MPTAVKKIALFSTALLCSLTSLVAYSANLAIVIDDIGYRPKEDAAVYAMPKEIAVAIIPVSPYASLRDAQAKQQGRDILIHLPMQPQSNTKIEQGGLTLGMTADIVAERVKQAKKILPNSIGMNNHMGSAATADFPLMHKLMTALQAEQLHFLDSKTTGSSVAVKAAKQQGVKVLERHIFLDDSDQFADVQRQFQLAIHSARKQGTAIVIGHPRKNTIAVLQAGLRQLPADIQLVSINSLWRNEKATAAKPFILLFSELAAPTNRVPYQAVPLLRGIPE